PRPTAQPITSGTDAWPAQVRTARAPLRKTDPTCVTRTSRLRSKRSAALPPHGASRRTGTKFANCSTPSKNGEWVRSNTKSEAARFWNHVPLADAAFPTKYGPKFRWPISRSAADGPVAGDSTEPWYQRRSDPCRGCARARGRGGRRAPAGGPAPRGQPRLRRTERDGE